MAAAAFLGVTHQTELPRCSAVATGGSFTREHVPPPHPKKKWAKRDQNQTPGTKHTLQTAGCLISSGGFPGLPIGFMDFTSSGLLINIFPLTRGPPTLPAGCTSSRSQRSQRHEMKREREKNTVNTANFGDSECVFQKCVRVPPCFVMWQF